MFLHKIKELLEIEIRVNTKLEYYVLKLEQSRPRWRWEGTSPINDKEWVSLQCRS